MNHKNRKNMWQIAQRAVFLNKLFILKSETVESRDFFEILDKIFRIFLNNFLRTQTEYRLVRKIGNGLHYRIPLTSQQFPKFSFSIYKIFQNYRWNRRKWKEQMGISSMKLCIKSINWFRKPIKKELKK